VSLRSCVLDASAVLAVVRSEPGTEAVESVFGMASISAVNWCEVAERAGAYGIDVVGLRGDLEEAGLEIASFDVEEAERAASLWRQTRATGLGIADRACLALAQRLGVPAVTADRSWSSLDLGIEIIPIR
jgi:ribonuclease VapC